MSYLSSRFFLVAIVAISAFSTATSLYAHDKAASAKGHGHDATKVEKKITDAFAKLSQEDRQLAAAQRFCPVMEYARLGAMGTPIKLTLEGKPVFVCCKGCVSDANEDAKGTLAKTKKLTTASAELAKLSAEDRAAAESQKYCAVIAGSFLGGMGAPIKLELDGKPVYLCCEGCVAKAKADPAAALARAEKHRQAGLDGHHHHPDHDLGQ